MKSAIKEALNFVHGDYRVQMPMKHLHQSVDPSRPSPGALVLHGAHSGYIDEVADSLNPSTVALMLPLSECRSPYQSRCLNKEFRTIELALGGVDLYGNFKLQGTSDRAGIPRRSVFHPLTKFPLFQKHYDEFHRSSGTVEERAARISDPNMARLASTVASPDDIILTPGNIDEQKPRLHRALALLVIIAGRRRGWATEPRELPAAQLELARKELDLDSGASSATGQGSEEALVDAIKTVVSQMRPCKGKFVTMQVGAHDTCQHVHFHKADFFSRRYFCKGFDLFWAMCGIAWVDQAKSRPTAHVGHLSKTLRRLCKISPRSSGPRTATGSTEASEWLRPTSATRHSTLSSRCRPIPSKFVGREKPKPRP